MWEIDIGYQAYGLIFSFFLGIGLALFYDILRAMHKSFTLSFVVIFICDVLYCFLSAVITFLFFMVFTLGQIRFFVFLGMLAGFIFSRLTVSKIFLYIFLKIFAFLKLINGKISGILNAFAALLLKILCFFKKILKNTFKAVKKLLKSVYKVLYTKRCGNSNSN